MKWTQKPCEHCGHPYRVPQHMVDVSRACWRSSCRRWLKREQKRGYMPNASRSILATTRETRGAAAEDQSAKCPTCRVELTFSWDRMGLVYEHCRCGVRPVRRGT